MTRRKQDAPKQHKTNLKRPGSVSRQDSADRSLVTLDHSAEDDEKEGEEGDVPTDEGTVNDELLDAPNVEIRQLQDGGGDRIINKQQGEDNNCHINRLDLSCGSQACSCKTVDLQTQLGSTASQLTAGIHSPEPLADSFMRGKMRHSAGKHLSTSPISVTPAVSVGTISSQMEQTVPATSVDLGHKRHNSPDSKEPALLDWSTRALEQQNFQPLDLSRKSERSASFSCAESKLAVVRIRSSSDSMRGITLPGNGISSLQNLQQKFGGEFSSHLPQKLEGKVRPLQTNITVPARSLCSVSHIAALVKSNPISQARLLVEDNLSNRSSPSTGCRGDNNRLASNVSGNDSVEDSLSKGSTIHRCSCQTTFSTVYSLSLHLQETGHSPDTSTGLSPSLLDYPKLVRGQDVWLNQESEQTRRILRCIQCGESFMSLLLLTAHMMQTRHYTNIVSSEHGRGPHKCATFCDPDLDRDRIFKCQVCHETFNDMDGLARHMLVSGHHKKRSSSHPAHQAQVPGHISATSRPGKRKRSFRNEKVSAGGSRASFTIASLLSYQIQEGGAGKRHMEKDSSYMRPQDNCGSMSPDGLSFGFNCDICGNNVPALYFNFHIQKCLRRRSEMIQTLRNKLNVMPASLSRYADKQRTFDLTPPATSDNRKHISTFSLRQSVSSDDEKVESARKSSPELLHTSSPSERHYHTSPELSQVGRTSPSVCAMLGANVPSKNWRPRNKSWLLVNKDSPENCVSKDGTGFRMNFDPLVADSNLHQRSISSIKHFNTKKQMLIKTEILDQEITDTPKSRNNSGGEHRNNTERELVVDASGEAENLDARLSLPNHVAECTTESSDCRHSALFHLDMFSRSLPLPPRRQYGSSESKLQKQQPCQVNVRKKSGATQVRSTVSGSSLRNNDLTGIQSSSPSSSSSSSSSSSPLSHVKLEAADLKTANMTFDIIDPNTDPGGVRSSTSVLEAMKMFINKSFSVEPGIYPTNLGSVFNPFRNCFPHIGYVQSYGGILLDTPQPTPQNVTAFSSFHSPVPGIPLMSYMASSRSVDTMKMCANKNGCAMDNSPETLLHVNTLNSDRFAAHKRAADTASVTSLPYVKVPVVCCQSELPAHVTISNSNNNFKDQLADMVVVLKNEKLDGPTDKVVADSSRCRCHRKEVCQFLVDVQDQKRGCKNCMEDSFSIPQEHVDPLSPPLQRVYPLSPPKQHVDPLSPSLQRIYPLSPPKQQVDPLSPSLHHVDPLSPPLQHTDPLSPPLQHIDPLPHAEPLTRPPTVASNKKRGRGLQPHLVAASSKGRNVLWDYPPWRGEEPSSAVKIEKGGDEVADDNDQARGDEENVMYISEIDAKVEGSNVYFGIVKPKDNAEIEKCDINTEIWECKMKAQIEKSEMSAEAEKSKVSIEVDEGKVETENEKYKFNTEVEKSKFNPETGETTVNTEFEKSIFNIETGKSEVNSEVEVKKVSSETGIYNFKTEFVNSEVHAIIEKCKFKTDVETNKCKIESEKSKVNTKISNCNFNSKIEKSKVNTIIDQSNVNNMFYTRVKEITDKTNGKKHNMVVENYMVNCQAENMKHRIQTGVEISKVNIKIETPKVITEDEESKVNKEVEIDKVKSEFSINERKSIHNEVISNLSEPNSDTAKCKFLFGVSDNTTFISSPVGVSGKNELRQAVKNVTCLDGHVSGTDVYTCTNKCIHVPGTDVNTCAKCVHASETDVNICTKCVHISRTDVNIYPKCVHVAGTDVYTCTNKCVHEKDDCVMVESQHKAPKTVSPEADVSRMIRTGNRQVCPEYSQDSRTLSKRCRFEPRPQHEHGGAQAATSSKKQMFTQEEALFGEAYKSLAEDSSDNNKLPSDNSCVSAADEGIGVSKIEDSADESNSDSFIRNMDSIKCEEKESGNKKDENMIVISDYILSQKLDEIFSHKWNNLECDTNQNNSIDISKSASCIECETKLEVAPSKSYVHCGNLAERGMNIEYVNKVDVKNKCRSSNLTTSSVVDDDYDDDDNEFVSSFICDSKHIPQTAGIVDHLQSETNGLACVPDGITKTYLTIPKGLQRPGETHFPAKNTQCLSECNSKRDAHGLMKQKEPKKKSALDYLSSFVYGLATEHPLDNLQRLLATNDLGHFQTFPEEGLPDSFYGCYSPGVSVSQNTVNRSDPPCVSYSMDNNDDGGGSGDAGESLLPGNGSGDRGNPRCTSQDLYHLNEQHLSSAKKRCIRETLNL